MTKQIKNSVIVSFLGIVLFLGLGSNVYGLVFANASEAAFEANDPAISEALNMQGDIVQGAEKFMTSYSQYLSFLSKVELTEIQEQSYEALNLPLESCYANLKLAESIYQSLNDKAAATPYKSEVLAKLSAFDYTGFCNREALNTAVFPQVESMLKAGDVRGIYTRLLQDMNLIVSQLETLKATIQSGQFPSLPTLWNTCQQYGQTMLYGQYVARVFIEIQTN